MLAALFVALIVIGWKAAQADRIDIQLPLLAVAGVLLLLMALAVTSVAFATFGLGDSAEALALPAGSVRAVIALSLVVIFSILTVFLYASLSGGHETDLVGNLSASDRDKYLAKFTTPDQLSRISSRQTGTAPDTSAGAAKGATVPTYTIYMENPTSQAGQDFAKQLLVMLGVLLSSVTGFYFGAKTAAPQNAGAATDQTNGDKRGGDQGGGAGGVGSGGAPQGAGDATNVSAATVAATPEAAALGQDPTLASQASADDLNKEAS